MARMIPLSLAEDEEITSSMARQWVFRDLNDPLNCYDDLELVRRFRFSRASISQITELIANYLNFTERFYQRWNRSGLTGAGRPVGWVGSGYLLQIVTTGSICTNFSVRNTNHKFQRLNLPIETAISTSYRDLDRSEVLCLSDFDRSGRVGSLNSRPVPSLVLMLLPPLAGLCGTSIFRFWNISDNLWRRD